MKPAVRDTLALLFTCLVPLTMAWLGFVALANDAAPNQSFLATVYSVGKVVQFAFPLIYVWVFEREQLRLTPPTRRGLLVGVAFGLMVDVGMAGVYFGVLRGNEAIADTPAKIFGKLQEFNLATPGGYVAIGLFLCVVHSLLEEYYWRWFVFGRLQRLVPLAVAIGVSSVAFMAHHVVILYVYFPGRFWAIAAPLSLGVAIGGGVWAWTYWRSGSLTGPWLSHVLVDAGILLIGYDLLRGMWTM
jgi:membrane protease YdiL (CAAX protease family)